MPSGAKRRKAAKKKKENEAKHDPLSTNESQGLYGNEDLKSQDEKGSDSGEVNSPASHNNDNSSDPFDDGAEEEDEQRDPPINVEATEKSGPENEDGTKNTEMDLKSGDDSKITEIPIESAEETWNEDEDNKSLNISNPDKESQVIEEKLVDYNSVAESYLYDDKPVDSSPHEKYEETINLIGKITSDNLGKTISVVSNRVSSGLKEEEEKSLQVTEELTENLVAPSDFPLKDIEDKVSPLSSTFVKYEVKVFEPPIDSVPRTRNDADDVKEIPEHYEDEPSVTSHPLVAKRTSVFSCCGLFDAFTGSK